MFEFVDKTSTSSGTPLNRGNLMAMQGFAQGKATFNADGSIVETKYIPQPDGTTKKVVLRTTFDGNTIIETLIGEKTITKTTTFLANGDIEEVIS